MVSVITIVRGRLDHLDRQAAALERCSNSISEYLVVRMGGPDPRPIVKTHDLPSRFIDLVCVGPHLPLAAARNAGASHATSPRLVFLDVDCIPEAALLAEYGRALDVHPSELLIGPVGYLPPLSPTVLASADESHLRDQSFFHDGRPSPGAGWVPSHDYTMFWSLSFAVQRSTYYRIGGFDERYQGYGGEDTDFAFRARSNDVPLRFIETAVAYHQHHRTQSPPVQHLADICRNADLFRSIWGEWPMTGWLEAFRDLGLIDWDPAQESILIVGDGSSNRTRFSGIPESERSQSDPAP